MGFWGRDGLEIVEIQNSSRPRLDDIPKVSGSERSVLHLRDLLSFLASSSVNDWWLLFALGKIQLHVTLCKWLFRNILDCSGNKMICPNISLGTMLQTLLNIQWKYRQFQWTLELLILNASNLGETIQASPKCTWLMCNYLVKLLDSSIFRMMIYPYIKKLQNIDSLIGRRGSG